MKTQKLRIAIIALLLAGMFLTAFCSIFSLSKQTLASAETVDETATEEIAEGLTEPTGEAAEGETEPEEVTEEVTTEEGTEEDDNALQALISAFVDQLKASYGDQYESYYNAIITEWGSVEEYLLSLAADENGDVAESGWTAFVQWLGEYSPIWGSALAIIGVIIFIVLGEKAIKAIVAFYNDSKSKTKQMFSSFNKIYAAHEAEAAALIKLLGDNPKFADELEQLKQATEEMNRDDV